MISFSLWDILRNLLLALRWTVALSLMSFVLGGTLGLILLFMRNSRHAILRHCIRLYIEVFQGTPLLMQLFLVFFGLALFGLEVPAWLAASLALTLWSASFLAEIWRGCVDAIPCGQWEASSCLAMNRFQQMRHIILPQALRIALPTLVSHSVLLFKNTSLAMAIGVAELTYATREIESQSFHTIETYLLTTAIYLGISLLIMAAGAALENRYRIKTR